MKKYCSIFNLKNLYYKTISIAICLSICSTYINAQQINGKGASTPFKTLEAESGQLSGGATVRSATANFAPTTPTPEVEASGRAFVELKTTGASITWTNNTGINSNTIVVRACIPDATTGGGIDATINLYVDGVFRQALNLTSKYTWVYELNGDRWNNNTPNSSPRRFYDEARAFITGTPIAPGSTITLKKDIENTASFYYIDLIDLEEVGPALTQPENSLSVTDFGAIANDGIDDGAAFRTAISACQFQKKTLWIPPGVFHTKGTLTARNITIAGAGMWYTTNYRIPDTEARGYRHKWDLYDCTVRDLYIFAPADGRNKAAGEDYGMTMQGQTGWLVERVWAHNLGVGFWMSGRNGIIRYCRSSTSWGDGINLNNSGSIQADFSGQNITCENNFVRGNTDDGIALNSQNGGGAQYNMFAITIKNNTSVSTIWANGLRIAGGRNTLLQNNLVTDVADNSGIKIARFGVNGNPVESATIDGNQIIRGTGVRRNNSAGNSGIYISDDVEGVTISNNIIQDCEIGLIIQNCIATLFDSNQVTNPYYQGFKIDANANGSATITKNTVTNLRTGQLAYQNLSNASKFTVISITNNSWQTLPVELTNYYAKKNNNQAAIYWATLSETNNSHFTIERSLNGQDFNMLGSIKGAENSTNAQQYEFLDRKPFIGTNYYRLIQYDLNGESKDYGIKTVKFSLNERDNTTIYPNPSSGKFIISFNDVIPAEKTNISIQDITGKTIYNQLHTVLGSKINVSVAIPNGYYILKATNSITGDITKKILIQQ